MESLPSGSGSTQVFITRRTLYDKMRESGYSKLEDKIKYMKEFIQKRTTCPVDSLSELNKTLSFFVSDFKKRWQAADRKEDRFLSKNVTWLASSIGFKDYSGHLKKKIGRPEKAFEDASERSKRLKTQSLRSQYSAEELTFAAQMSLRSVGKTEASKIVKEITTSSPERASRYLDAYKTFTTETKRSGQLAGAEALSMCIEAKLTRHQYNIIREKDRNRFPSYKKIQTAKKECYPDIDRTLITETLVEIKLQSLLDHTASRILQVQKEVLEQKCLESGTELNLICKWGFDGSAQREYKQRFSSDSNASDASVFITSLVPLRLVSATLDRNQLIVWQNPRPSSTRYCRPIRFRFEHETTELSKSEKQDIEKQIEHLIPLNYTLSNNIQIKVQYSMLFTMVDGKVCNAVTDTSSQRCFICGLSSKDFNNIKKVCEAKVVENSRLDFGLSVLHAWIRFFECLLHLSYKLPIQKWQGRGTVNKEIIAVTKKDIQNKFKSRMGLLVDIPKPGFGSSNDGNTARRFFNNPELSADITGVHIDIIKKFKIILQTLASGYEINVDKFKDYALKTAVLIYSWYPMPPSIHKILIHDPKIIDHALLPIGQLSEEAQEARNKEFKKYREEFSRKISRVKTNEDILNWLLISSDPVISSFRKLPRKKNKMFDKEVLDLLIAPEIDVAAEVFANITTSDSDSDSYDSSD